MQIQGLLQRLLLASAVLALSDPALAARVVSITTSKAVVEPGYMAVEVTDRFAPNSPEIHVVALLTQTRRGSRFTGRWISLDATDAPNFVIAETDQEVTRDGRARLHFLLTKPTRGWPAGNYRFDLYQGDKRVAKVGFMVVASPGPAPADTGTQPPPPPHAPPSPVAGKPAGDTSTTAPLGTPPAVPPKPAQPGADLVGTWESEAGEVLVLDGDNYALYEYKQLVDGGTYDVQGATLTARSREDSNIARYRFQADGTTLLLQDALGAVWAFQRIK